MLRKKFWVNPFRQSVSVWHGNNEHLWRVFRDDVEDRELWDRSEALTVVSSDGKLHIVLLSVEVEYCAIVHESYHAICRIADSCGFDITGDGREEFGAYLIGHLSGEIIEWLYTRGALRLPQTKKRRKS